MLGWPSQAQSLTDCSLHAGVKEAVIDAVEELYIRERQPQDIAQALIDLTHGSNLGAHAQECPTCFPDTLPNHGMLCMGCIRQRCFLSAVLGP